MRTMIKTVLILILLAFAAVSVSAQTINDKSALADLKTGKGVFLIDIGDAKKMNFYLEIIQGTYQGMINQGVKPDFILVYIGPSVKYLTTSPAKAVEDSEGEILLDIESNVSKLARLGIKQEICAVATRVFGVDNATLFPELKLIGDGFISLIGYQAQGYNLVPVF